MLSEEPFALFAGKRVAGLVAQVVHADEELSHKYHRQVAALRGKRDFAIVIGVEGAVYLLERHLYGQARAHTAAEIALEFHLVQTPAEELHHKPIPHAVALGERVFAHDGHAPRFDSFVVLF